MFVYFLYILTVLIGIYAVLTNLPALLEIGMPKNETIFAKFMVSFFPVVVGLFMIYFGTTSIYSLVKKSKKEDENWYGFL